MHESHTNNNEIIRTMTPMEYIKVHAAEDAHRAHIRDLHEFIAFMAGELQSGDLSNLTPEGADRLIDAYVSKSHG